MDFKNNNATLRENRGFKTNYDPNIIRQQIGEQIAAQKFKDAERERFTARAILKEKEKNCTEQLLELGKLCAYIECFDNILVTEQNIPQVGPFANPIECESFQKGYAHGKLLVEKGLEKTSYKDYQNYYENKYMSNGKNHQK